MNSESEIKEISFDIYGEFITQIAREWFYTGEKSHEKVIEILMESMTGTDTPEAQIRRYAEDILLGRAALKGSTVAGTYHLETYEPGEEEQMPQSMNIWKEVERRKKAEKNLRRMIERWDVAMDHISESTQREIRKELGEETAEDRQGMKIAISGRIQTGSYTNRDGAKVYKTEVVVEDQEFAESKSSRDGAAYYPPKPTPSSAPAGSADGFMDVSADEELPFN